jgi:hypothetical protein
MRALILIVRVGKRRVDEKRGEKVLLLLTAVEDSHRPALSPEPCGQDEEKANKQLIEEDH